MELPEETVDIGDYDFSGIPEYSDLEYRQFELSSRAERRFSEDASAFVGVGWYDLRDDAPYTYGDMSGSVVYTHAGIETRF